MECNLLNFKKILIYPLTKVIMVCSFDEKAIEFKVPDNFDMSKAELVLFNYNDNTLKGNSFITRPYETRVYLIK